MSIESSSPVEPSTPSSLRPASTGSIVVVVVSAVSASASPAASGAGMQATCATTTSARTTATAASTNGARLTLFEIRPAAHAPPVPNGTCQGSSRQTAPPSQAHLAGRAGSSRPHPRRNTLRRRSSEAKSSEEGELGRDVSRYSRPTGLSLLQMLASATEPSGWAAFVSHFRRVAESWSGSASKEQESTTRVLLLVRSHGPCSPPSRRKNIAFPTTRRTSSAWR